MGHLIQCAPGHRVWWMCVGFCELIHQLSHTSLRNKHCQKQFFISSGMWLAKVVIAGSAVAAGVSADGTGHHGGHHPVHSPPVFGHFPAVHHGHYGHHGHPGHQKPFVSVAPLPAHESYQEPAKPEHAYKEPEAAPEEPEPEAPKEPEVIAEEPEPAYKEPEPAPYQAPAPAYTYHHPVHAPPTFGYVATTKAPEPAYKEPEPAYKEPEPAYKEPEPYHPPAPVYAAHHPVAMSTPTPMHPTMLWHILWPLAAIIPMPQVFMLLQLPTTTLFMNHPPLVMLNLQRNLNQPTKNLSQPTKSPSQPTKNQSQPIKNLNPHTRNLNLHTRNLNLHTRNLSLHTKNQKQPTNSLQITMPRNQSTVSNPSYLLLPHLPKCITKLSLPHISLPTIGPAGLSSVLSTSLNQLLRWLGIFTK